MNLMKENSVEVGGLVFEKYISADKIKGRVDEMASEMDAAYQDKDPIFIAVLNGSFIFCSDLVRASKMDIEIEFIKVKSYEGLNSSGKVHEVLNTFPNVAGRHVVLVEDIVDKGHTIEFLHRKFSDLDPASIAIVSLLLKPKAYTKTIDIDFVGFEIPNDFVLGYGLDYNGLGRSLEDIYCLND